LSQQRILIVTDQYFPMVGGVAAVTHGLAAGLSGRGHAVTLLAPSARLRSASGMAGQARVRCPGSVPWPWYQDMRVARLPVRGVREIFSSAEPDVIHVHSPLVLGVLARRRAERAGIPVIYTNHYMPANVTMTPGQAPRALDNSFYSWVCGFANRCDYVTAPSKAALGLLREHGLRVPCEVISNGVDTSVYSPGADGPLRRRYGLSAGSAVILAVGRLSGEKCLPVLLDATARLTMPAQLVIAGAGPDRARLQARAASLGIDGRVAFLGHVPGDDLPGLYRMADIFAIASQAELQSLATMEAMASGLPVVAAAACALPELVSHGRNGYLFSGGDAEAMAGYLDALISDQGMRHRMGAESLRLIARHGRDGTLRHWESLYAHLSGQHLQEAAPPGSGLAHD
jgi:glycosyltransferase involved in cell wall biosynthesis